MNKNSFFSRFGLGAHLCREPMPAMTELKHDMEILKKNGFNLVKLQEHWMVDEPLEGQSDFSRYEELIAYADRLDMGVYLGLTCEQAPGWLYRKYPDARMVGRDGRVIRYEAQTTLPADGKPGPCYDHPGAAADQNRFITRLVRTLGPYENIVVWNTWQEIAYWPMQSAGQPVCFCENTLASFRRWLQQKYGDLDGLNRAWNSRYGDWNYVQPDRGANQHNALPQDGDWRYFMDNVQVADVLRMRAAAIKAADPYQRPVFAHKGGIALGMGQDWNYARTQDFLGSSCYPAWNPFHEWDDGSPRRGQRPERVAALSNEMAGGVALTFDEIRSCNPPGAPVWAAEFQGGPVSTMLHKGRVPEPGDLRRWMLTAAASGVTTISFWVTRAEIMAQETNGFSLLDSAGDTSLRLEEAARVGAALNRHADLFGQPSWGGAQAAILVSEESAQFCTAYPPAYDHLAYDVRGWHRLLWNAGIPLDFLEESQLEQRGADYKAVIVPFPVVMSDSLAEKLVGYAENGGNLICEAAPGRLDEHGFARRGELSPVLASLFGVRQKSLRIVREPGDQSCDKSQEESRWTPNERTWGEFLDATVLEGQNELAGLRLPASFYLETFECLESSPVLGANGDTAGVRREAGKGQAWLLGTFAGHSALAHQNADTPAFVRGLLGLCGVKPLHSGRLIVRKRSIPGMGDRPAKRAWFFTNPTGAAITDQVEVGMVQIEDLFGTPLERQGSQVTLTVEALDVRVLVATGQA